MHWHEDRTMVRNFDTFRVRHLVDQGDFGIHLLLRDAGPFICGGRHPPAFDLLNLPEPSVLLGQVHAHITAVYVTSWENKYPHKLVTHIDYHSTNTPCTPFCVAMTAEGDGLKVPIRNSTTTFETRITLTRSSK
jgi:hypothetical protein